MKVTFSGAGPVLGEPVRETDGGVSAGAVVEEDVVLVDVEDEEPDVVEDEVDDDVPLAEEDDEDDEEEDGEVVDDDDEVEDVPDADVVEEEVDVVESDDDVVWMEEVDHVLDSVVVPVVVRPGLGLVPVPQGVHDMLVLDCGGFDQPPREGAVAGSVPSACDVDVT